MTGQGTYTHSDGSSYEGEWKDGKQDGQGTYTWSDGKKYVGEWKEGYKTGKGIFSTSFGYKFKYNIHSSLPKDWVNEFYLVMNNLDKVIPVKPTNYFSSLDIYTWNSSTDKPFKNKIGNYTGACICGDWKYSRFMVLEIPADEFKYNYIHRYSVIPHEYFHAFQMSLSKNFYDGKFKIKWLTEGAAASFESLYTQQYYNINHFKWAQNKVHIAVVNNPEIFESYDESREEEKNYSFLCGFGLLLTWLLICSAIKWFETFTLTSSIPSIFKRLSCMSWQILNPNTAGQKGLVRCRSTFTSLS